MRSSHSLDRLDVAFDDDRLVADAGLLLPAPPAQHPRPKAPLHDPLAGSPGCPASCSGAPGRPGAGPGADPLTIDLDSTICETYGLAKDGARHHTYTHVRGYHPLLPIAAGTGAALM